MRYRVPISLHDNVLGIDRVEWTELTLNGWARLVVVLTGVMFLRIDVCQDPIKPGLRVSEVKILTKRAYLELVGVEGAHAKPRPRNPPGPDYHS